MKKILLLILVGVVAVVSFYFASKPENNVIKIGLVVPVQNVALDDIVDGFKSELSARLGKRAHEIHVQNAIGDINLQRSAINQFVNQKVDLLVPVGKGASLMALNLAPREQNVLFLAALIPPQSETAVQKPGLMGVIDEIPITLQLDFMRAAVRDLKKLTVVYVAGDKIFDDVKELKEKALSVGINVQQLMVHNLAELYTVSSQIDHDSQAIFTLKDVMVASGINALVQQANSLKIPLITSDEGTIRSGGAFAVGVTEADIGRQGARIAGSFFDKENVDPIQYLNTISVFVNRSSCTAQGVDVDLVKKAASELKLSVVEG